MRRSVTVREARPEDNDALIALDAACSMGEAVPLCFDRSPDFFARSASYERVVVLAAVSRAVAAGPRDAPPLLCRPVFLDPADL